MSKPSLFDKNLPQNLFATYTSAPLKPTAINLPPPVNVAVVRRHDFQGKSIMNYFAFEMPVNTFRAFHKACNIREQGSVKERNHEPGLKMHWFFHEDSVCWRSGIINQ